MDTMKLPTIKGGIEIAAIYGWIHDPCSNSSKCFAFQPKFNVSQEISSESS